MDDEEFLMELIQQQIAVITAACTAAANSVSFFDDNEMEDQTYVDSIEGI
jgi:hypothetical protein